MIGADSNLDPDREVTLSGLAPAAMSYRSTDGIANNFADGVVIWTGSGDDLVTVDGRQNRHALAGADVHAVTTLNTGAGNDTVNVSLTADSDSFFVLNTGAGDDKVFGDGATAPNAWGLGTTNLVPSTLPLIIFGGDGNDQITAGTGDDVVFGDLAGCSTSIPRRMRSPGWRASEINLWLRRPG